MSRSYRHQRYYSVTCSGWNGSLKEDKRMNNQLLRARSKQKLKEAVDYDGMVLPERLDEVMDRWSYIDDGRMYYPFQEIIKNTDKPWQYLRK